MAINQNIFLQRPSDRNLFLTAAAVFPLLILIGYFQSSYSARFSPTCRSRHARPHSRRRHVAVGLVFLAQIALVRSKNVRLHMSMGLVGIALATLAVVTAWLPRSTGTSSQPRREGSRSALVFLSYRYGHAFIRHIFAAAIYYRQSPFEHKTLMLMTAINFLPRRSAASRCSAKSGCSGHGACPVCSPSRCSSGFPGNTVK
jgi:hypothetical protein